MSSSSGSRTRSSTSALAALASATAGTVRVKQEAHEAVARATAAEAATSAAEDRLLCVVCLDADRSVVYVPCAHFATCAECDEGLEAQSGPCPICQQAIVGRVREVRLP